MTKRRGVPLIASPWESAVFECARPGTSIRLRGMRLSPEGLKRLPVLAPEKTCAREQIEWMGLGLMAGSCQTVGATHRLIHLRGLIAIW